MAQYLGLEDYLAAQAHSIWLGEGGQRLGLKGQVEGKPLKNLLRGSFPDGKTPLVKNAGSPDRQSCWDLTFSVPKSVSVLWALLGPNEQAKIEKAVFAAVSAVSKLIERELSFSRRGHAGKFLEPADLVYAAFLHFTSRAQDPQLHVHLTTINAGYRSSDGTWGTILSKPFFENKMALGALFRMELATRLEQALSLRIEKDGKSFKVQGVPEALCKVFSKRSEEIKAALASLGLSSAEAAAVAALDTRKPKHNLPRPELVASWRKIADEFGWGPKEARELLRSVGYDPVIRVKGPDPDTGYQTEPLERRAKVHELHVPEKAHSEALTDRPRRALAWEKLEKPEPPGDKLLRVPVRQLVDRLSLNKGASDVPRSKDDLDDEFAAFRATADGKRLNNRELSVLRKAYELKGALTRFVPLDPTQAVSLKENRDYLHSEWFRIVEERKNYFLFGEGRAFEKLEHFLSSHTVPITNAALEDQPAVSRASQSRLMKQTLAETLAAFPMRQILPGRDLLARLAEEAIGRGFLVRDVCDAIRHHWPETLFGLTVKQKRLFPHAPFWSPFKDWSLPHLAFPEHYKIPREIVVAAKEIPGFSLELLKVRPFHEAPKWSRLGDIKLSAVRVRPVLHEQLGRALKNSAEKPELRLAHSDKSSEEPTRNSLDQKLKREIETRTERVKPEEQALRAPKMGGL